MDRAWYWKAGLILAVTVLSVWALVPSFTYFRLPAGDRNEANVFEKARPKWAPAKHLNLGLDLQGGIHLVMGVEVDRAVREKAVRRAEEIAAEMDRKGVKGADVRGDPDTGIVSVTAPDLGKAKDVLGEWTDAPDVALSVTDAQWHGIGDGHGHLQARRIVVETAGRRGNARPQRAALWLPSAGGGIAVAEELAEVRELRVS